MRILVIILATTQAGCSLLFDFPVKPWIDSDTGLDVETEDTDFDADAVDPVDLEIETTDLTDLPSEDSTEDDIEEVETHAGVPCALNGDGVSASDSGAASNPSAVWTGSEFGVVWQDLGPGHLEIYFNRMNWAGGRIGGNIGLTSDAQYPSDPDITWTGSEFGVVWAGSSFFGPAPQFARIQADGVKIGSDLWLSSRASAFHPVGEWSGSEFGLFWNDSDYSGTNPRLMEEFLSADGTPRLSSYVVDGASDVLAVDVVWTGSQYGLAWVQGPSMYAAKALRFVRISPAGDLLGAPALYTAYTASAPSIAWTGSGFGIAWSDIRDDGVTSEVYFVGLTPDGVEIGSQSRLTPLDGNASYGQQLTWTGSGFGLAWFDLASPCYGICFARLEIDGSIVDGAVPISPADSAFISLAWTGSQWGVAYDHSGDVYFNVVGICDG